MAEEEIVEGLPWPILYIVHSVYDLMSDENNPFVLHKDTGVSAAQLIPDEEIFASATEQDFDNLQFAGEGSRGVIVKVVSQHIARILFRA